MALMIRKDNPREQHAYGNTVTHSLSLYWRNPTVPNCDVKYLIDYDDVLSEMTQTDKDNLDNLEVKNYAISKLNEYSEKTKAYVYSRGYDSYIQSSYNMILTQAIKAGYTNQEGKVNDLWDWVESALDHYYTIKATIVPMIVTPASYTMANVDTELANFDTTQFDATDPILALETVKGMTD